MRNTTILGWLNREFTLVGDDEFVFTVRGRNIAATSENDVCLPIYEISTEQFEYPACPDCGGKIVWAEAGGVPGTRRCIGIEGQRNPAGRGTRDAAGCGSRYADSRYAAGFHRHRCERHPPYHWTKTPGPPDNLDILPALKDGDFSS